MSPRLHPRVRQTGPSPSPATTQFMALPQIMVNITTIVEAAADTMNLHIVISSVVMVSWNILVQG